MINKFKIAISFLIAFLIRTFIPVNKYRIFCWSYNFSKYACNPRAITEWLLSNNKGYEIYWAFNNPKDINDIHPDVKVVKKRSIKYFVALYSSKFIFNNTRNYPKDSFFIKKKSQKYIMTWHSSMRLKRIENDASEQLGDKYMRIARRDSEMCDLMLSNSQLFSSMIRSTFLYNGEILENCIPRNDIFYNEFTKSEAKNKVYNQLHFSNDTKVILYAPTFRKSKKLDYYNIDWPNVIAAFEKKLNSHVEVLIKLHPNIINIEGIDSITSHKQCHNITQASDITDFLLAADVMISDYTSAMFDFALLRKPCFIYAIDKVEYNRGFYWDLSILPFPIAENSNELIKNIFEFDIDKYNSMLNQFQNSIWRLNEDGKGCERLYNWMERNNGSLHN